MNCSLDINLFNTLVLVNNNINAHLRHCCGLTTRGRTSFISEQCVQAKCGTHEIGLFVVLCFTCDFCPILILWFSLNERLNMLLSFSVNIMTAGSWWRGGMRRYTRDAEEDALQKRSSFLFKWRVGCSFKGVIIVKIC